MKWVESPMSDLAEPNSEIMHDLRARIRPVWGSMSSSDRFQTVAESSGIEHP